MAFRVVLILMLLIQVKRLSNTFFPIRRNQSVGSVIDFNWLRLISVNASYFVDRHKPLQIFYILRAFHSAQPNSTQLNGMDLLIWDLCFCAPEHTLCGRFMNCAVCAPNGFNLCNAFSTRQKPSRPECIDGKEFILKIANNKIETKT